MIILNASAITGAFFLFQTLVKVRLKRKLVKVLTKDLKSIILDTSKCNDGYFY